MTVNVESIGDGLALDNHIDLIEPKVRMLRVAVSLPIPAMILVTLVGQGLTLAHLGPWAFPPTAIWFPACASGAETGARRGCVVLARDPELIRRIDAMRTLRRWTPARP